jgi:hypothetical protein
MAHTSSISPAVTEAAPAKSKWRCARVARLSRSSHGVTAIAAIPTGTLTKKIHDQFRDEVNSPPSSTPAAAPLPRRRRRCRARDCARGPSAKVVVSSESAAGASSAPPRPWSPRNAISEPSDQARPQSSELSENSASPLMNRRRRPSRSASRPPRSSAPPKMIA